MKRALAALLAVQLVCLALTFWASFTIALGANPESLQTLDVLAPLFSLFLVAFWLGQTRNWRAGLAIALPNIAFWALMHVFVATRFHFEFWRDGFGQLSLAHLGWWTLALCTALFGALAGEKIRFKAARWISIPFALLLVWLAQLATPRDFDARFEADDTTVRLRKFDLRAVNFGVFDADFNDAGPLDNRNATWLSLAMPRVWKEIARQHRQPLCVVNGGFFGATSPLIAQHEAPLRANGRSFYDVETLQSDWPDQNATLVWRRENGVTKPHISRDASFERLRSFDGALGGVRVLICDGKSEILRPGMGGTTLKCSRTSVAWNARTNTFWILSVRDPDGEASSVRDNKREKLTGQEVQVGGWSVAQVQRFWQTLGATDAVLFDGGESGQIAYRNEAGRWRWIHSSYHLSRTPFFLRGHPLRAELPMLPPTLANGGVLNWFYVSQKF